MCAHSSPAKYLAVRESLAARVKTLSPGTQLPTEADLCEEYGVSRITLRHAVDGLISSGIIERRHGRGTFVAQPAALELTGERFAANITGFFTQLTAAGFRVTSQVLTQRVVGARGEAARQLNLAFAEPVVELVRLRKVDGQVHHLARTWLPAARFPLAAETDFTDRSLYQFLSDAYGVSLTRNDVTISLCEPEPGFEHLASTAEPGSLLHVASTVFQRADPVSYGTSVFAASHSTLFLSLRAEVGGADGPSTSSMSSTPNTSSTQEKP